MLLLLTILLIFIILSRVIETSTKIPATLTTIILSFLLSYFVPNILNISKDEFDDILYLMLPVILLPDILNISTKELQKHYKEIIYLAFIAVICSIALATFILPFILPQYQFTIGMLIALFSMLMATDAITVSSIMSKFKLPKKLKIYAESESLFNDVTSLIIFYFIALPMISGNNFTFIDINLILVKVLFLSTLIGIAIASIGYIFIKILKDPFEQLLIIYLVVIISFFIAEYFQIAGILSIVTSVLTFRYLIQNQFIKNKKTTLTKKEFKDYKKESEFIGIFANTIIFIIVANIVDISSLLSYSKEILIIFILTTVIRFIAIETMIKRLKLPFRWSKALTYSGTKGALAIIMVHSLPDSFIYQNMFTAIIIGNVLLSTFIYTISLMIHINLNKQKYKNEMSDNSGQNNKVTVDDKDLITRAYKQPFIEDIIEIELKKSQQYKTELSLILLDLISDNKTIEIYKFIGEIINKKIRSTDYFGIYNNNQLIIVTPNTSLSGAMILAEKLETIFTLERPSNNIINVAFGITQAEDIDTYSSIIEKLQEALNRASRTNAQGRIEIEI